jgi:FtsZ-binding cell division protein ZapB
MKKKLLIVGISFITLICLQIFSSGNEHVVVVDDNIQLTGENKQLTTANKKLTNNVNQLKAENQELTEEKTNLETMISAVIGDLDSTKSVVKNIKKELAHEKDVIIKQSTGDEFDFQPIKLPAEDDNQR